MSTNALAANYFWIRRLHSLSGLVPIGAFVLVHLFTNAYSWRPEAFNEHVKALNETPLVNFIEYFGIIAPIAFHAILGTWMAIRMDVNQPQYSNFRNWMYFLQRVSGVVVLAFIVFHLIHFRFMHEGDFKHVEAAKPVSWWQHANGTYNPYMTIQSGLKSKGFIVPFYLLGIVATAFHLANGVWSFCVTWGITVGRRSQLLMSYATMGLFVGVSLFGVYALFGFLQTAPGT
jgi:succinate dehydrogenase / fumarate reductase cytochrome b subunit